MSVTEMMERYKLSRVIVNIYARRCRKGLTLHDSRGRPKVLDADSNIVVEEFMASDNGKNLNLLRNLLRSEYVKTLERRGKWSEDHEGLVPEMSERSLVRCISHFSNKM